MVSGDQVMHAVQMDQMPKSVRMHAEVAQVEDRVTGLDDRVVATDQFRVHLFDVSERPVAVPDHVDVIKVLIACEENHV